MARKQDRKKRAGELRIAAYVRVSTQRQASEGDSLEAQENDINKAIEYKKELQGWKVGTVEFFRDAGRSAKDQNRPELQRLRRKIEAGEIDIVICSKLDRLTRSLLDFAELWELFGKHTVGLLSLREDFDTSSAMGEAMLKLIMVFAELERKLTGERTSATMKDRAERGLWNGGLVYGYVSNPDNPGELLKEEEWASIIQTRFFDAFEELGSAGKVQQQLAEKGIYQPEHKTRSGNLRGGKAFSKQQVVRILRNPVYIGRITWGDASREDCHEPLITREQFERVQSKLDENTQTRSNHRYSGDYAYPLKGLVRCGCGAMMTPKGAQGRKRTHYYYECTQRTHKGAQACDSQRIPAEALEKAVVNRLIQLGIDEGDREKIVEAALRRLNVDEVKLETEISALETRLAQVKKEIRNLVTVLAKMGEKALGSVEEQLTELEQEKTTLEERQKVLSEEVEPVESVNEAATAFIREWRGIDELLKEATPEELRLILPHFVEVIELRSINPETRTGTYALRLFPTVAFAGELDLGGEDDTEENVRTNSSLTGNGLVRRVDEKAP